MQVAGGLRQLVGVDIGGAHARSGAAKRLCDALAEPAPCAGDEHDLLFKLHGILPWKIVHCILSIELFNWQYTICNSALPHLGVVGVGDNIAELARHAPC